MPTVTIKVRQHGPFVGVTLRPTLPFDEQFQGGSFVVIPTCSLVVIFTRSTRAHDWVCVC